MNETPQEHVARCHAILIGVGTYKDNRIPPTLGATSEVAVVRNLLLRAGSLVPGDLLVLCGGVASGVPPAPSAQGRGSAPDSTSEPLPPAHNLGGASGSELGPLPAGQILEPTLANMRAAFEQWLPERARSGDLVLIYYGGQGGYEHGEGGQERFFLLGSDAVADRLGETALDVQWMTESLRHLPMSGVMACYNTGFNGRGRAWQPELKSTQDWWKLRQDLLALGPNSTVMMPSTWDPRGLVTDTQCRRFFAGTLAALARSDGSVENATEIWIDIQDSFPATVSSLSSGDFLPPAMTGIPTRLSLVVASVEPLCRIDHPACSPRELRVLAWSSRSRQSNTVRLEPGSVPDVRAKQQEPSDQGPWQWPEDYVPIPWNSLFTLVDSVLSPTRDRLARVDERGLIFIYELPSGRVLHRLRSPYHHPLKLSFSGDGRWLAAAGYMPDDPPRRTGCLRTLVGNSFLRHLFREREEQPYHPRRPLVIYDVQRGECLYELQPPRHDPRHRLDYVACSPSPNRFVTHGDFVFKLWNLRNSHVDTLNWRCSDVVIDYDSYKAGSATFSSDGRILIAVMADVALRFIEVRTHALLATGFFLNEGHDWVILTPDGRYEATSGAEAHLRWRCGHALRPLAEGPSDARTTGLLASLLQGDGPKRLPIRRCPCVSPAE